MSCPWEQERALTTRPLSIAIIAAICLTAAVSVVSGPGPLAATLSVDQAKNLIDGADSESILSPEGVSEVDPSVCEILIRHKAGVNLSGLKAIDEPVARVLAKCEGHLILNGLEGVPDSCAEILAGCPGTLSTSGLSELRSVVLAKKLASQDLAMNLPKITSLPLAVADVLGNARAIPVLDNLETLESRLLASRLADREGEDLTLASLQKLSVEAAVGLSEHPCDLRLPGLRSIDGQVAAALSNHRGVLDLDQITAIKDAALVALLANQGTVDLGGLESIGHPPSPEVLDAIRQHEGMLGFDRLKHISPELARAIRGHRGVVTLNSVERLSEESAKGLVGAEGDVWVDSITVAAPFLEVKTLLKHRGPGRIVLSEELNDLPRELFKAVATNPFLCLGNVVGCGR